jgi:NAD+ diphosphatase
MRMQCIEYMLIELQDIINKNGNIFNYKKHITPIKLTKINYLGSQPWPFPASLMIAFEAITNTPELARPDGDEIEEIRWFSREEMKSAILDKSLILPFEISVARQMINAWYGDGADKDLVGNQSW